MWWERTLSLLELVPASFWGVVAGSFLTLLGVIGTNRAHDRRLAAQLAHDRDLHRQERELALRKDIYLAATEALQAGLTAISRFGDLSVDHDELLRDYTTRAHAIAKVHVVANTSTAKAFADITGAMAAATLRLMLARAPIVSAKAEIDYRATRIDQHSKERDRWLEAIKQFNVEGLTDERRWQALQANFDYEQQQVKTGLQTQASEREALQTAHFQLVNSSLAEYRQAMKFVAPLVVAVRSELGIQTDAAAYTAILDEATRANEAQLTTFLAEAAKLKL